jgi:hypothetical protein
MEVETYPITTQWDSARAGSQKATKGIWSRYLISGDGALAKHHGAKACEMWCYQTTKLPKSQKTILTFYIGIHVHFFE